MTFLDLCKISSQIIECIIFAPYELSITIYSMPSPRGAKCIQLQGPSPRGAKCVQLQGPSLRGTKCVQLQGPSPWGAKYGQLQGTFPTGRQVWTVAGDLHHVAPSVDSCRWTHHGAPSVYTCRRTFISLTPTLKRWARTSSSNAMTTPIMQFWRNYMTSRTCTVCCQITVTRDLICWLMQYIIRDSMNEKTIS